MNTPINPFERDGYIAKEFGTITVGRDAVNFDVVTRIDADKLLPWGEMIGRVGSRVVVSDQIRSIPSSISPMEENLINTAGKGIEEKPPEQIHQSQLIRKFIEDEAKLPKPYEGYCI